MTLISQKMGIHEWSYDNDISLDRRKKVPLRDQKIALADVKAEVELGFDRLVGYEETQRCLNCDVQTVFATPLCIECDACVDICPMDCITFTDERRRRPSCATRLTAPAGNLDPGPLYLRAAEDRAGSWPRTRMSACIAGFAPSAARPAPGTCRSSSST